MNTIDVLATIGGVLVLQGLAEIPRLLVGSAMLLMASLMTFIQMIVTHGGFLK